MFTEGDAQGQIVFGWATVGGQATVGDTSQVLLDFLLAYLPGVGHCVPDATRSFRDGRLDFRALSQDALFPSTPRPGLYCPRVLGVLMERFCSDVSFTVAVEPCELRMCLCIVSSVLFFWELGSPQTRPGWATWLALPLNDLM